MADFITSIGYSLERLHSGLIVYLCHLYNEGEKEPLRSFASKLGVSIKSRRVYPELEYEGIDLVILPDTHDKEHPLVVLEMKVDSREQEQKIRGKERRVFQTAYYADLLPKSKSFLFITLGAGEFCRAPYSNRFKWVKIRDFCKALNAIRRRDPVIRAWRRAVQTEIDLQDLCFANNQSRRPEYRARTWNMYFLGALKDRLMNRFPMPKLKLDPAAYMEGRGPDTILNFGWSKTPVYMEINQNGRLNLKLDLQEYDLMNQRQGAFSKAEKYYNKLLREFSPSPNRCKRLNERIKTITIMSFDIGLEDDGGYLSYQSSRSETLKRLANILKVFYGSHVPRTMGK